MRRPASPLRTALNVASVAILAITAASCSNSLRLKERPLFTGSTANQRQIIGESADQPMPAPISGGSAAVTRAELPPPPTVVAAGREPAPLAAPPLYAWTAVGGTVITVAPGETLGNIAIKYGVPPEQILNANQLMSAADVRPGRILVIPHRVAMAPEATAPAIWASAPAPTPTVKAGAATHVVQSGETLYSIARRYGAKIESLAALNDLTSPEHIRVGQTLRIPADAADQPSMAFAGEKPRIKPDGTQIASLDPKIRLASPAETAATGRLLASAPAPRILATPSLPVDSGASSQIAAAGAVIDEAADPPSSDGTSFRWPVRGRIISGFGTKPNGEKNDGINLAVPEGTSVKAVEAGAVIYAGNELEGYGNLILVRHANGWVSAYAHNKELLVKRGDTVKRGQIVARAGMTGSVSAPQVHFELRKEAKPVNPLDYLTG